MSTSKSSRLTSAALAAVAGLAVLAPAAHAAAGTGASAKLTVDAYTHYLKKQAAKSPAAKKAYVRFRELDKSQKATFVKTLQNRKIYRALQGKAWGKIRDIDTIDHYDSNVSFLTKVSFRTQKDKLRTTKATFSVTETIFKIPVTTQTVTLTYPTVGKSGKVKATARVANLNAALAITAGGQITKGNHTRVNVIAVPTVKSFGAKVAKVQNLRADRFAFLATLANGK